MYVIYRTRKYYSRKMKKKLVKDRRRPAGLKPWTGSDRQPANRPIRFQLRHEPILIINIQKLTSSFLLRVTTDRFFTVAWVYSTNFPDYNYVRYADFSLTVVYLVVFVILITQSIIASFSYFRLTSVQISLLFSIASSGKLMHMHVF